MEEERHMAGLKLLHSNGMQENGVIVGNTFNKYASKNPIIRWMLSSFTNTLDELVSIAAPASIHEIGCGEGHWVLRWNEQGYSARGCDYGDIVIDLAKRNAEIRNQPIDRFETRSVYALDPLRDRADLIVCCEVLEHLTNPVDAIRHICRIADRYCILSVPNEPIWRLLNVARGKYLSDLGNTPGHLQHWSKAKFIDMVSRHMEIIAVRSPFPWTMVLCSPLR